ncbi:hypothetical protein V1264_017174 [Littorina saxatilis]|uniref:Endonuclease n=2 Tax=Littorina saxatilis TaxID=31220 RepID=A0AAN9BIM0_9CAEN
MAEDGVAAQPRSVTVKVPLPQRLELSAQGLEATWRKFKRSWETYELASRLDSQDEKYRAAVFKTCLSDDARDVFEGLPFEAADDKDKITKIIPLFEAYCVGETSEVYETYKFHQRKQEKGETIDTYIGALRQLASSCNFKTFEERMLRDQVVIGLSDDTVREKLLQESGLTLKKCIEICRVSEAAAQQAKSMAGDEALHRVGVHVRKKTNSQKDKGATPKSKHDRHDGRGMGERDSGVKACVYCGKSHKKGKEHCFAYGKTCNRCKKKNHFARQCKQSSDRQVHEMSDEESDDDDGHFVLTMSENDDEHVLSVDDVDKSVHAKMLVGHDRVTTSLQLDSGATINSLSVETYKTVTGDVALTKLTKSNKRLLMYDNRPVTPLGERILPVVNPKNGKSYKVRFVVVNAKVKDILGCRASQHMQLITVNVENISAIGTGDKHVLTGFDDVFKGEVGALDGKLTFETDPSVPPVKLPCRQWPIAVKEKVKAEIDRLLELGVLVPVNTPTDWISSVVVTLKPNGQARLCIDPKPLNKALKRNDYPMKSIDDALESMVGAKIFSHFDMRNGFWHVVLDDESSLLTTFETPFGKFRWTRMPFGASVCPEEFQRRVDDALNGLPGVFAVHDDVIVWGSGDTEKEAAKDHDQNVRLFLQRCREKNIKLNKEKVEYRKTEVSYLGHVISKDGLKCDMKKVDAIKSFPQPEDKAAVQRLLGMVGYLQKFAPRLSEVAAPLRELVKKDVHFRWDENLHGKAFDEIKRMLTEPPVLRFFDPGAKTTLQCDASEFGLGACLLSDGQPVQFASRALTQTERNYAQIEKEMLAILFGLERFERYVYGRHVEVESDHKPLIPIHNKTLLAAPKRLQRMLLRTQKFDYTVVYKKGTEMYLADTLSRAVVRSHKAGKMKSEQIFQTEIEQEIESIDMAAHVSVSEGRLEELKEATKRDKDLCRLMQITQEGWPESRQSLPLGLQPYFPFREEVSTQNGLCFKAERIIVPTEMREKVLHLLHQAHTGIQGCMRRARELVYWPGMNADIEKLVSKCATCQTHQSNQQKEPMISHPIPERPWETLGCDLFDFQEKSYLVVVDYYSDFFEVDRLENKTAEEVIYKTKAHLARHGIPDKIISDNGPPYSSDKYRDFAEAWEFEHITSSPYYPQSNGKAENAVKQAKTLIMKAVESKTDPYLALLELRNIPSEVMKTSPVQRLFSRRTKTRIPTAKTLLKPQTCTNVTGNLIKRKEKQTKCYNKGTAELETLQPGQTVRVKLGKTWTKAKVEQQVDVRSYKLHTENGKAYRRNRRQIRTTGETLTNTGPRETITRKTDLDRQRQLNDQAVKNYRAVADSQTQVTKVSTPVSATNTPENKTPVKIQPNEKKTERIKVKFMKSQTAGKTDTGQSQITSRGRQVKPPAYLNDYVKT